MVSDLILKLEEEKVLSKEEFAKLISERDSIDRNWLYKKAENIRKSIYGTDVYIRGLIEITSYCKNNCYYCGIRNANHNANRYRLSKENILECCKEGYKLGFRTFVMQGGEDPACSDEWIEEVVSEIKNKYSDCAVTLSVGERSYETYKRWFDAGADRYLLRHETADDIHYRKLHPSSLSLDNRKRCLYNLREIGYQTGSGFMVGSPYQLPEYIAEDLIFLYDLKPQMIGIGPFIPHHDTIFKNEKPGTKELTLFLLSILRIMFPSILLPATTALGTISQTGREEGILAGANVVMPNLSPLNVREKYLLYDNKICTGEEAAEGCMKLKEKLESIGYKMVVSKGDYKSL